MNLENRILALAAVDASMSPNCLPCLESRHGPEMRADP